MNKEHKELLLKDLCARLPYGIICKYWAKDYANDCGDYINEYEGKLESISLTNREAVIGITCVDLDTDIIKPYLRPMSSMTEEEKQELEKITYHTFKYKKGDCEIWTNSYHRVQLFNGAGELYGAGEPTNMPCSSSICIKLIDWLNKHHFDYRGLIEKGLAIEAPKGMYNLK